MTPELTDGASLTGPSGEKASSVTSTPAAEETAPTRGHVGRTKGIFPGPQSGLASQPSAAGATPAPLAAWDAYTAADVWWLADGEVAR